MIKRKRGKDDSDEDAYSEPDPAEEADPFFEHEDSAFDDPFFKVSLHPYFLYHRFHDFVHCDGGVCVQQP